MAACTRALAARGQACIASHSFPSRKARTRSGEAGSMASLPSCG
ncbi:MAG: hypothetical protein ABR985_16830 [Methanotrichaceae archaeon]